MCVWCVVRLCMFVLGMCVCTTPLGDYQGLESCIVVLYTATA